MYETTKYIERISIVDFMFFECPFGGCINNEDGRCKNENPEFLHDRLEDINFAAAEETELHDFFFDCKEAEVENGFCRWCGTELVQEGRRVFCPQCDTGLDIKVVDKSDENRD